MAGGAVHHARGERALSGAAVCVSRSRQRPRCAGSAGRAHFRVLLDEKKGKGIGLAMVRQFSACQCGTVRYARSWGTDARFMLTFDGRLIAKIMVHDPSSSYGSGTVWKQSWRRIFPDAPGRRCGTGGRDAGLGQRNGFGQQLRPMPLPRAARVVSTGPATSRRTSNRGAGKRRRRRQGAPAVDFAPRHQVMAVQIVAVDIGIQKVCSRMNTSSFALAQHSYQSVGGSLRSPANATQSLRIFVRDERRLYAEGRRWWRRPGPSMRTRRYRMVRVTSMLPRWRFE